MPVSYPWLSRVPHTLALEWDRVYGEVVAEFKLWYEEGAGPQPAWTVELINNHEGGGSATPAAGAGQQVMFGRMAERACARPDPAATRRQWGQALLFCAECFVDGAVKEEIRRTPPPRKGLDLWLEMETFRRFAPVMQAALAPVRRERRLQLQRERRARAREAEEPAPPPRARRRRRTRDAPLLGALFVDDVLEERAGRRAR